MATPTTYLGVSSSGGNIGRIFWRNATDSSNGSVSWNRYWPRLTVAIRSWTLTIRDERMIQGKAGVVIFSDARNR